MIVKPYDLRKDWGGSGSDESVQMWSTSLFYSISSIYLDKYGVPLRRNNVLFDTKDNLWIQGNREIEISLANGFVNIFYTDLAIKKRMEMDEEEKMTNKASDTKQDI